MQYYSRLACEQGEGKEGGKERREAVEMPKDFDFHMPEINVMFKLTYWVASTTTAASFEYSTQVQSWVDTFLAKLEDLSIHQIFNSLNDNPLYISNEVYGN